MERQKTRYIETDEHAEENMVSEGGPAYYIPEPPLLKLEPPTIPALESPIPTPELPVPQKGSERFSLNLNEKRLDLIVQGVLGVTLGVVIGTLVLGRIFGVPSSILENPLIFGAEAALGALATWGAVDISRRIFR